MGFVGDLFYDGLGCCSLELLSVYGLLMKESVIFFNIAYEKFILFLLISVI
jgi:hypothetical protein